MCTKDEVVNVYPGDQNYENMAKTFESFVQQISKIINIELLHATHHGLLTAPIHSTQKKLSLKISGVELPIDSAVISNDFSVFKENVNHKLF